MSQVPYRLWCLKCQKETLHIQKSPSHRLHFFLSLATFGLWIIPWIWISLTQDCPRCSECGSSFTSKRKVEVLEEDWRE